MRKRHGPARDRQLNAVELHLAGHTYRDIAQRLGYRSEAGARMAVNRDFARRSAGVDERREKHSARLEKLIASHWSRATSGRDAVAANVVMRAMADYSRLWGLDAAQRHLVVGISEVEFAKQAAELLKVTGIKPLVELAAPVLSPSERAAWFSAADATADDEADDVEPWSNITGPGYLRPYETEPEVAEPGPEPEPAAAAVIERAEPQPEAEEVAAELVDEPPLARRIPASEVLDEFGVPVARSGYARRLGGYDPLAAWRP